MAATGAPAHVPGIVAGLAAEARCFERPDRGLIELSGGDSEHAAEAVARLIAAGAPGLISFGLAGGLDPSLRPGTLVLPETVLAPDGSRHAADSAWRARLLGRLGPRLRPVGGTLLGVDGAVATVADKARLHAAHDAAAVDMESHRVALAATAAGLPFLVVRALADPAGRALPATALSGLGADGRARIFFVLGRLAARPGELPGLLRLALEARAGLAALRRVARLAGRDLGFVV